MGNERFVVVGAGIVGLATARQLALSRPGAEVTVVEKESGVGRHQTSHSSGVVHAGLYYQPGSLKALLCARGRSLLKEYCTEQGIDLVECGKVVVARDRAELGRLDAIESSARANGVPGLARLDRAGLAEVEPHAAGVAALHSPHTAIVDFLAVAKSLAAGTTVELDFEVDSIDDDGTDLAVGERGGLGRRLRADRVILCAGLQSDRVARMAGDGRGPAIIPFRGEYWRLRPHLTDRVKGLIYPVPDPRYPFLGVHFTRRVDGGVDVGPNAVLATAREGYRRSRIVASDLLEMVAWPGTRAMARRHWRAGLEEMRGSLSRRAFMAEAATLVPGLGPDDVTRAPSGVRAQAVERDGTLLDDFCIRRTGPRGRVLAVRNAPSPAATSCLAIAEYIVGEIEHTFG